MLKFLHFASFQLRWLSLGRLLSSIRPSVPSSFFRWPAVGFGAKVSNDYLHPTNVSRSFFLFMHAHVQRCCCFPSPQNLTRRAHDIQTNNELNTMSSAQAEDSYGFNIKTLACGKMRIDQWISAFGTEAGPRERENELEDSFDVHWLPADACNPNECNVEQVCVDCSRCNHHCSCNKNQATTKKSNLVFGNPLRCDPRTCMTSNVRIAVAGSEEDKCDRKKCNDMYFCEDCSKCRQHCRCNDVENNSICNSTSDAFLQSEGKKHVLYSLKKRDMSWHTT